MKAKQRGVPGLRARLVEVLGVKRVSRAALATALKASPGSIYNWECGTVPSRIYIDKIIELERTAKDDPDKVLELLGAKKRGKTPEPKAKARATKSFEIATDSVLKRVATLANGRPETPSECAFKLGQIAELLRVAGVSHG